MGQNFRENDEEPGSNFAITEEEEKLTERPTERGDRPRDSPVFCLAEGRCVPDSIID